MRGGVHVDAAADAAVGQDEAERVVDRAAGHLVGREDHGCDGEAARVGGGAALAAPRRVGLVEIPDGGAPALEGTAADVGPPHLVELVRGLVDDEEVAVAVGGAGVAVLLPPAAHRAGGRGEGDAVAVGGVEVLGGREGAEGHVARHVEDLEAELDVQLVGAPPAVIGEPADDGRRRRARGKRRDVLGPGLGDMEKTACGCGRRGERGGDRAGSGGVGRGGIHRVVIGGVSGASSGKGRRAGEGEGGEGTVREGASR